MRRLVLGVMALALFAGCGGSDSEDDDPRPATRQSEAQSKTDEFVRRVDAVCKDANPDLVASMAALIRTRDAARAGRVSARETFARFATLLRKADRTTEQLEVRLRAVMVPRQEKRFHDALVDSIRSGSRNLREQVRAAEAQDARRLSELSRQGSIINARAKGLITGHGGFRHCGRG